ncbi:MAG: tetratricopeptide repeat protein, partial [Roseiflexaceae bacterium]|nr:tetratricopeptide repeat protein [Roseiflexaceae bacterium]
RLGERGAQSRRASAPVPVTVAPAAADTALAAPATPFFGRQRELAWIAAAVADPNCRLVTIVGPGGMGKTRLALQAAQSNRSDFPDGVHHISLVGVTTTERLLTAITDGLGIAVQGDPETYLVSYFHAQRALLVLDNIEQALAAADALARMLRETQQLKLLVTSRERLHIQDEWVLDIDGLEVPDDAYAPDAASYSAIQLFVQRARRVRSNFQLGDEDLASVIEICQLVDGMPLAIELAAAWVRVLSCAEIIHELEQSMGLLTTTLRDVPERHRSIEGVFTQAWERLAPEERQTLRRLSVFEDGTPRAAAAQVVGASPVVLAALADRALIRRDTGGRYIMHELLRQFAARKLANHAEEQEATWRKYCEYYMALLERRGGELEGPHQRAALQELGAEFDNIQDAWTHAIAQHLHHNLAQGLDGLYRFCDLRGWYQDGTAMFRQLTEALAQNPAPTSPALHRVGEQQTPGDQQRAILEARAQARQGALLCWVGQYDEAQALLEQALATLRAHDCAQDEAATINWMGMVAYQRGDSAAAEQLLGAGLAANQQLQLHSGVAWSLDMLGDLASDQGDYERARELLNDSIMRSTALGDQASAAWSLSGLGRVLMLSGEREEARQLLEENGALFRSLSDPHGLAVTLANLGELALESGDTTAARSYYLDALHQARLVYAIPLVLDVLAGYATVLSREGAHERALDLAITVLENPASWRESVAWAEQVRAAARAAMPTAGMFGTELRAHGHTWEDVSEAILQSNQS